MEIRQLRKQGLTISEISRRLEIDRKTVRAALRDEIAPKYERISTEGKLSGYRVYVDERLEKYNLTSQRIFEEIVLQGFCGRYGIVNRYVRMKKGEYKIKAVLRFETIPGEQSQVDWAYFGEFYDEEKKKHVRLCCFLMVLGYSRMKFIHFFESDDTHHFLKGHNLAFEYFGGYTKEILYDNLKSVVIKRAFRQKDCEFNKEFMDFSGYYGFKAVLAQPYRPQTKGKVENTVRYVRESFFNGQEFKSVVELNGKAREWLKNVNEKIHHTTHEKPVERLSRENLIPVVKRFDLSRVYYRKVQSDCHFSFRGNFYSCEAKLVGKEVVIREDDFCEQIFIYYRNERVGLHRLETRFKGGYHTSPMHYAEIKKLSEIQSKKARMEKKKEKRMKNELRVKNEVEYIRSDFDSRQVVQLFPEVEKRDLKFYEEVAL